MLYAFGFPGKNPPKSVPMNTVLHRLTVTVPEFSDDDFKFATSVVEMRNAELHSADSPFETFKPASWLPRLMHVSKLLCESIGKSLVDVLGPEEAKAAEQSISALEDRLKNESFKLISECKKSFDALDVEERLELVKAEKAKAHRLVAFPDKVVACPSCGTEAILKGRVIRFLAPRAADDGIEERAVVMPQSLDCSACGLSLSEHGHLFHQGMGEQYTLDNWVDPKDYFGIEFDPAEYFEADYGND